MNAQKSLQWSVQKNHEHLLVMLSGDLTRDTLLPLWGQRASFLSPNEGQDIYWDLKKLARIDSAGFVLLAEMLCFYQKKNQNCLVNTPDSVVALAELFNLQGWLNPLLLSHRHIEQ